MDSMATLQKLALVLFVVVAVTVMMVDGKAIELDDSTENKLNSEYDDFDAFYRQFLELIRPPTVEHFATHNLCRRLRRQFEFAMAKKLWSMNGAFVHRFVHKLCDKKPTTMLKLWVAELFDYDGNGYIDEHEKHAIIDTNDVD